MARSRDLLRPGPGPRADLDTIPVGWPLLASVGVVATAGAMLVHYQLSLDAFVLALLFVPVVMLLALGALPAPVLSFPLSWIPIFVGAGLAAGLPAPLRELVGLGLWAGGWGVAVLGTFLLVRSYLWPSEPDPRETAKAVFHFDA